MVEKSNLELSIVTTLYHSRPFLEDYLKQVLFEVNKSQINNFELLFVNDGSPDDSLEFLLIQKKNIPQIKVIDLSRNFGHHLAIQEGLIQAKGDLIFLIDNDLETPSTVISQFIEIMRNDEKLDVIFGFQENRKGNLFERISGGLFWKIFNLLSDTKLPNNIVTERLMKRKYVTELMRLGDANLFIFGMFHWVGFNQKGVSVKKGQRQGKSTYTRKKKMDLMIHAITSFSGKPLEWLFYFGLTVSLLSVIVIFILILHKLIYMNEVKLGWTSLIAVNIFILGILSTFLGVIGMYVNKIFRQVQARPNVIIRSIYD